MSRAAAGVGPREVYDIIGSAQHRNGTTGVAEAPAVVDGCCS